MICQAYILGGILTDQHDLYIEYKILLTKLSSLTTSSQEITDQMIRIQSSAHAKRGVFIVFLAANQLPSR